MQTIVVSLLVLAVALLLYYIRLGKRDEMITDEQQDPLAGLPDFIGRPKTGSNYKPSNTIENVNRDQLLQKKAKNETQQDPDQVLPDWSAEEEEMSLGIPNYLNEGFATGVTFDELALAGEMLSNQKLGPSEQKTTLGIASKIDGTQLLELLESKIGDASKKIALLLDSSDAENTNELHSLNDDFDSENFDIGNYV